MDWMDFFLSPEQRNRRDIKSANESMKRMRRRMIEETGRDHQQDARIEALEQENDQLKLMLMDLINTLVRREVITEEDTIEIIKRVAVVSQDDPDPEPDAGDDPLIDFQRALQDD